MVKPEIIIEAYDADTHALKEILAGIEEEGVLCKVIYEETPKPEDVLGRTAAGRSQLEVGIGISRRKAVLYIKKMRDMPLLETESDFRSLGQNAARYVKGEKLI